MTRVVTGRRWDRTGRHLPATRATSTSARTSARRCGIPGRPDEAIAQFNKSLAINPTHPQTLFNLGIVKRDGKQDPAGAVQAWEKLLAANPTYAERDKVQQLLDQLKQQLSVSPLAPVTSTK